MSINDVGLIASIVLAIGAPLGVYAALRAELATLKERTNTIKDYQTRDREEWTSIISKLTTAIQNLEIVVSRLDERVKPVGVG